jgi:GNAT superfamily N-acetyltransferase
MKTDVGLILSISRDQIFAIRMTISNDISVRNELRAGDLGRIIALHGECYDALPGFGLTFEAYVARTIAEYILDAGTKGRIWMAERAGQLIGCTAIVLRDKNRGQLRWVLVDQSARGLGLGKRLVNDALHYCRNTSCKEVFLETTDGLPESQALYDALGFKIVSHESEKLWDGVRPLIHMKLEIN